LNDLTDRLDFHPVGRSRCIAARPGRAGSPGHPAPAATSRLSSRVFPGLWLDVPALLAGDVARVLATLQLGLTSPEHAAWLERPVAQR